MRLGSEKSASMEQESFFEYCPSDRVDTTVTALDQTWLAVSLAMGQFGMAEWYSLHSLWLYGFDQAARRRRPRPDLERLCAEAILPQAVGACKQRSTDYFLNGTSTLDAPAESEGSVQIEFDRRHPGTEVSGRSIAAGRLEDSMTDDTAVPSPNPAPFQTRGNGTDTPTHIL